MLSKEQNELMCRVGQGTPMGNLLRQFWIPALPSSEFGAPDSPPKRMRLLGENLVMFRDTNGDIGCLAESCPHRGASLFFGRNEEAGLRCVYHGWKFDLTGQCIDMPSEPSESNFRTKVKAVAYPCRDVNHMIWAYLGPREVPPPFPEFEITRLPPENVEPPVVMMEEANWVQNLEGDIDTLHTEWVHARLGPDVGPPAPGMRRGTWNAHWKSGLEKEPAYVHAVPTEWGAFYNSRRKVGDENLYWHRIGNFIFPFHDVIGGNTESVGLRSHVPVDDEHSMLIKQSGSRTTPVSEERRQSKEFTDPFWGAGGYVRRTSDPTSYFYTVANKQNDYHRDYDVEKTQMMSGVPFIHNLQDRAMTELMTNEKGERIYDRSREHLGTTDAMCITVRRQLIRAAVAFRDQGVLPINVDNVKWNHVHHACGIWPLEIDWIEASDAIRDPDAEPHECICGQQAVGGPRDDRGRRITDLRIVMR